MHVTPISNPQGDGDASVVAVVGEVDADNCDEFRSALLEQASEVDRLVVDLSGLTFIDSSGISELLRVSNSLSDDGRSMTIKDPSPAVQRVLEITGLLDHFGLSA